MFFFSECELKKALRDTMTRAAWYCMDSYRPRQISQSDCEISSNCGKICVFPGGLRNRDSTVDKISAWSDFQLSVLKC